LFRPLEAHLGDATAVYIVPDATLHYIPFEALITSGEPRPSESKFLLNKYRFTYVPSAGVLRTVLADERRRRATVLPQRPFIVFANPNYGQYAQRPPKLAEESLDETWDDCGSAHFSLLPHTEEEARSLAHLFDLDLGSPAFNVRGQADEGRVKSLDLSTYRYVHFATHGLVCEQDSGTSLQPSLVLSLTGVTPEQEKIGNEGFLQMDEIFNLKLNADLVTLSACKTVLGRGVEGEGLMGLTRAFMYAGTPSVLVSQWNVADKSTPMFMNRFYSNLRDGMKKGEALHDAKKWMLENSSHVEVHQGYRRVITHNHPYFWAPFILVGASQ
jgi:CHAT domain-containing protein